MVNSGRVKELTENDTPVPNQDANVDTTCLCAIAMLALVLGGNPGWDGIQCPKPGLYYNVHRDIGLFC